MQTGGAGQIIHQNGGKMKIYVTGEGMVTALGRGVDMNVKAIRAGRSGVAMHTGLLRDGDGREFPVMCGMVPEDVMREISEEYPSGNGTYTRLELLAAAALGAARQADGNNLVNVGGIGSVSQEDGRVESKLRAELVPVTIVGSRGCANDVALHPHLRVYGTCLERLHVHLVAEGEVSVLTGRIVVIPTAVVVSADSLGRLFAFLEIRPLARTER